jgi:hypothetical protein
MRRLIDLLSEMKPEKLISVGDRVSRNMIKEGILPDVLIVDNKVMRRPVAPIRVDVEKVLRVSNPAGTLTDESYRVINEAVSSRGRVKVQVEGEEDLLTLIAVLSAPVNSVVVYGQPKEGIVVVRVTDDAKRRMREIIERMDYGFSETKV